MRRPVIWMLALYLVIFLAFFGIHYFFLASQGFERGNYLIGLVILLPGILVVGYVFLTQLLERQEQQEERLEHLVREVLHEINLPIATIEANLDMVQKRLGDGETKLRKRLERIGSAARRLKKLYRELAYNIRREIMPAERERFDLARLIEERAAFFREMGRNEIYTVLEPTMIEADRIGMEQVVDNLLENAVKYSKPESPVEVKLQGGCLGVQDRGRGMDENQILHIFERYYQGDRRSRGEGIGLTLVKRYCDENSITLKIRSQKGEGTEILLYLDRCLEERSPDELQR